MSPIKSPFEQWIDELNSVNFSADDAWDPGFDGGRELVVARLGPWQRAYQRPANFSKRFYHTVHALPIADWRLSESMDMHNGFCHVEALLLLRFQASIIYAKTYSDALPDINQHIKSHFEGLVRDIASQELRLLEDGDWVDNGLAAAESRLQTRINEALTAQLINIRALCNLNARFADADTAAQLDGRFIKHDIYLKALRKNFQAKELQEQERQRQELALLQQQLAQRQALAEQSNREDEIKRAEQAQAAQSLKLRLEDRETQLDEQLLIEQRMHERKLKHQQQLQVLEQQVALEERLRLQAKQFDLEKQIQNEEIGHQKQLKAQKLAADIDDYTQQQASWNEANERFRLEKIFREERLKQLETEADIKLQEAKLLEEQKLQERMQEERLRHENRLKEIELEMEIQEQKRRYDQTQKVDEYLRHDIELLILEKHRSELIQAIKQNEQNYQPSNAFPPDLEV